MKRYMIITRFSLHNLEEAVDLLMKAGNYEPAGGPFETTEAGESIFAQAIYLSSYETIGTIDFETTDIDLTVESTQ